MANVEVTKANAAEMAKSYGVDWNIGQRGRKPITKLYDAMVKAGDTPTGDYVRPANRTVPVGPGERNYDITRKFVAEVETKSGAKRKMPRKETVRVNVAELREILNHHARGKLGHSRIVDALRKLRDNGTNFTSWTDEDIENASVTPVVPKSSKAKAESPVKPRNARSGSSAKASGSKPRSKVSSKAAEPATAEVVPA